jgi:hypothetical protein
VPYREIKGETPWIIVLVSLMLATDMANNAARILQGGAGNVSAIVAGAVGWPPVMVAASFVVAALLALPNVVCVARQDQRCERTATKTAVIGFSLGAVLWLLMAWLSSHDHTSGWLFWLYGQRAVASMSFAAILGATLNNARRREIREGQVREAVRPY